MSIIFFDSEKNIRKELLNEEAKEIARKIVKGANSQLRKFYGEFKGLQRQIEQNQNNDKEAVFRKILPLIKLNNAKVAYAKGRKVITDTLAQWLKENIEAINNKEDFEAFLLHFEAVVGFYYEIYPKD